VLGYLRDAIRKEGFTLVKTVEMNCERGREVICNVDDKDCIARDADFWSGGLGVEEKGWLGKVIGRYETF